MDTFPEDVGGDFDLDALMMRVQEAAMSGGPPAVTPPAQPAQTADLIGSDFDLMRVIDAQGEWNEQTRKSLAALASSLRTLRDDWADAHARVCREVERLAAAVERLDSVNQAPARRKTPPPKTTPPRVSVKRCKPGKARGPRR